MIIAVKQELIKFPGNETVMVKIGSLISIPYKYSRSEWIWDAMFNQHNLSNLVNWTQFYLTLSLYQIQS
jgi:hypothetical protein